MGHLIELRNRLLKSIAAVILVFISLAYFANDIYHLLRMPLMKVLPAGASMIATDVAAPFFAPFKLTFIVACLLSVPYILFQIWRFVAPALYTQRKTPDSATDRLQHCAVLRWDRLCLLFGIPDYFWILSPALHLKASLSPPISVVISILS